MEDVYQWAAMYEDGSEIVERPPFADIPRAGLIAIELRPLKPGFAKVTARIPAFIAPIFLRRRRVTLAPDGQTVEAYVTCVGYAGALCFVFDATGEIVLSNEDYV